VPTFNTIFSFNGYNYLPSSESLEVVERLLAGSCFFVNCVNRILGNSFTVFAGACIPRKWGILESNQAVGFVIIEVAVYYTQKNLMLEKFEPSSPLREFSPSGDDLRYIRPTLVPLSATVPS
jgi:hypothetical protein